ncbi:MAG: RNA-guided endonuclease InsQ/TnpB family protein [Candidatus Kariarchaeaceae archaeon]
MEISRGYKVELKPNNKQITLLKKHAGTSRFAWNWGLAQRQELYKWAKKSTNSIKQHKELNKLKRTQFPWMYEVSKCAPQEALRDLDRAFENFYVKRTGFPNFKKKGKNESFRLTGAIRLHRINNHNWMQLPRLKRIRLKEFPKLKNNTKILSATVSCQADRWFVSLTVKEEIPDPADPNPLKVLGLDLGISKLAVLSNSLEFESSKPLITQLRKLRKISKELSRRVYKSHNWFKSLNKVKRLHFRISCQRVDILSKLSAEVLSNGDFVVLEDLDIKNMVKNRKLARSISDMGWGKLRRQLEYKAKWFGKELITAPRFFPSSKLCFNCEQVKKYLELCDRIYKCDACGFEEDRDLNAALNLEKYGRIHLISPQVAASWAETLNVRGAGVRRVNAFIFMSNHINECIEPATTMKQKLGSLPELFR